MDKRERKNYLINRCYSAQYNKLPEAFKTVNALRYVGLGISILANSELFSIQNLTPECTDVLLNSGSYSANAENLDYTLNVFYELNYVIQKMRFIGDDVFAYNNLSKIVKTVLRLPKIHKVEIVACGDTVPDGENLEILRNPYIKTIFSPNGSKVAELRRLFDENEINYEEVEEKDCVFAEEPRTIFVEGKLFRCPVSAAKYAQSGEADEKSFVDIVARKLQIKDLRLAMFDITNSPPPEDCDKCEKKRKE